MAKARTKTDTSEIAKETKEVIKPTKPSVILKYPECIHFFAKCTIKGTDQGIWDDIWYISNQTDKHLCYKLDFFCNIKEEFIANKLDNQLKFLFTYGIGEVIIKDGGQGYLTGVHYAPEVTLNILSIDLLEKQGFEITYENNRCSLVYMFNNTKNHKIDEDRMRTMQNQYLEDYFESLTKKDARNEEDLIQIKGRTYSTKVSTLNEYVAFLNLIIQDEVQEYNCILNNPTKKVEEDIERICPMSHQWDFDETCAPLKTTADQEGKRKLEHFGVKLEDTEDGEDSQPQPIQSHYTRNQNLQGMIIGLSTSRKSDNGDSSSNTSDDFTIIT
nr:ARID DNA-binding domain-containing protein [Tanacetum cinerariifolium]